MIGAKAEPGSPGTPAHHSNHGRPETMPSNTTANTTSALQTPCDETQLVPGAADHLRAPGLTAEQWNARQAELIRRAARTGADGVLLCDECEAEPVDDAFSELELCTMCGEDFAEGAADRAEDEIADQNRRP